ITEAEKYCQLLLRNCNYDIDRIIQVGLFGAWNFIFNAVLETYEIHQHSTSLRYFAALIFQKKQDIYSSLNILAHLYNSSKLNNIQCGKYVELLNVYITNQTSQIQNLNNTLNIKTQELTSKTVQINSLQTTLKNKEAKLLQVQNLNNTLDKTVKEKDIIINSNTNQINQLQNNIKENLTQLNQLESKLSFQA
ncbi:TPA: hypothetical protein SG266_001638, partial [Campylobacter coli]|nr:hypothetical protein [Campylobacter coli]